MTPIIVNDTNIIIDLIKLDLLESFTTLGFELWTTGFVVAEIVEQSDLFQSSKSKFNIYDFDENGVAELLVKVSEFPALSVADVSVLELAKQKTMILCTTDGKLAKTAQSFGVTSHGLLWIFEEYLKLGTFTKVQILNLLEKYTQINPWLKRDLIDDFIAHIQNTY